MYKHVKKQQKLTLANKPLILSDEESDSSDPSSQSSDSEQDFNSDSEQEDLIESVPTGGPIDSEEEESEEEATFEAPPAGFPTCLEAIEEGGCIAEMDVDPEAAVEEVALACVVCPNKILKLGKMLLVHLGSKDHLRRISRFRLYVKSEEFPIEYGEIDARSIATLLDKQVNARMTSQSQFGGNAVGKKRAREEDSESEDSGSESDMDEVEGKSKRAEKKEGRIAGRKERKLAVKAKVEKLKKDKVDGIIVKPTKSFKPKPTPEEIEIRQAAKLLKRSLLLTNPPPPSIDSPAMSKRDSKKLERKLVGLAKKPVKAKMFDGSAIEMPAPLPKKEKREIRGARGGRGGRGGRVGSRGGRGGTRFDEPKGPKKPKWAKNAK